MKRLALYDSLELTSDDDVFNYLIETLRDSLRSWDYFVNWDKAFRNAEEFRQLLEAWKTLQGSVDFHADFTHLLRSIPELVTTIPALIVRDGSHSKQFSIVSDSADWREGLRQFDFSTPAYSEEQISAALEFVLKSGLVRLFTEFGVSNVSDYLLGVEAGVDSNARKNRGGTAMEYLVGKILDEFVDRGLECLTQPYLKSIESEWGLMLPGISSGRRFDYAVWNGTQVFLIEVNAYGGGGSKLKATAGEFMGLQQQVRTSGATFIWITEGAGWLTNRRPLREAFDEIDHIVNLRLIEEGVLEEILAT